MPQPIRTQSAVVSAVATLALPALALAAPPAHAPPLPTAAAGPLAPIGPQPQAATQPAPAAPLASAPVATAAAPAVALTVTAWGFSQTPPHRTAAPTEPLTPVSGRPLYIWLVLDGNQAAVAQLQSGSALAIQVHWTSAIPSASAPDAVTVLTVGRPDLAPLLAGEVRRTGHFVWHSWARKDTLVPGRWIVSLTDLHGQPLQCGTAMPRPCQMALEVG